MKEQYLFEMRSSFSSEVCEEHQKTFNKKYDEISNRLEDLALDVYEIASDYEVEQNLVSDQDRLIKKLSSDIRNWMEDIHTLMSRADKEIRDYQLSVSNSPSPEGFCKIYVDVKNRCAQMEKECKHDEDAFYSRIISAASKTELDEIEKDMRTRHDCIQGELDCIKKSLDG